MGLLGPCWVRWHCVQKSAPQVRQEVGVSLGLSRMGVMAQGSKGVCLKEDRLQSLPILGEPGKPNSSPGSLSWVSPAGAEYLPLTPKHADPLLGTLAWEPWPGNPGELCFQSPLRPHTSWSPPSFLPSFSHHPAVLVFLRAGVGVGRKRLPPTTPAVPSPALAGRGGGAGRGLSPTRRWLAAALQSRSGRGRSPGRARRARGRSVRGVRGTRGRWVQHS